MHYFKKDLEIAKQSNRTRGGHSHMRHINCYVRLGIMTPYTKEWMELLCFLPYIIGSKDKTYDVRESTVIS